MKKTKKAPSKRKPTSKKKAAPKSKVKVKRKVTKTKKIRCAAKTAAGKRCKRFTDGKSKYCSVHKKKR
ncbi:MAG: hypothetical protein U9N55_01970 [candidate division Zixibacteria bacterium]|nr:hypothetical protein [candidate division Zixibacteria bacterium]